MNKYDTIVHLSEGRNPLSSFFLLVLLVLAGLTVGQFVGSLLIFLMLDISIYELATMIEGAEVNPRAKIPLYIIQACSQIFSFLIAPFIYLKFLEKKPVHIFFKSKTNVVAVVLTFLIVIGFIMVNSVFIEWNSKVTFPEYFAPFERWALEAEENAKVLTQFLTTFDNFWQFLLAIVVVAVIPAIGEELLFRGLIQNQMVKLTKNIHVAIWVTGIIFSAIHLQFYGFAPRMFLGVLFGYMYYWSGNLIIPIVAHFINNAFSLLMIYLYQINTIEYDLDTEQSLPVSVVAFSAISVFLLLVYFRKIFMDQPLQHE